MTPFDTWLKTKGWSRTPTTVLLEEVWDAAVAEERERCCRILAGGDRPWREHVAAMREGKA